MCHPIYHQPIHTLYSAELNTITLGAFEITITYVEEHDKNTVEFPHRHPEYEIYYVMKGNIFVFVDDQPLIVSAGEFLFLNKDVQHSVIYEPSQPKSYLAICFNLTLKSLSKSPSFEEEHINSFYKCIEQHNYFLQKDTNHSEEFIQRLSEETTNKDWCWFYQLELLCGSFILSVLKNFVHPISAEFNTGSHNMAIEFTKYMHANYQNPNLSIQDLADHFYMSTRHINRLFKEFFGSSLTKTLTIYRINYVKNYLQDTDYSLDKIAEEVGLSSASVLSRLFKEIEGVTITEYRKMMKESKNLIENYYIPKEEKKE